MAENITVSAIIPARAERVFAAWLDPAEHAKMTGGAATDEGEGQFTAWDGYITGRTLASTPNEKIVQSWRTSEFPDGAPDSTLTVRLEPAQAGTRVTLVHENVPDGQGKSYEQGWQDHYFAPMQAYFTSPGEKMREVGEKIGEAFEDARVSAQQQARKAVREVKRVEKKVAAQVKKFGKKVQALVAKKPAAKKPAAKKPAAKKPAAKKPAAKKPAAKKPAAKKSAAKKKAPARKPARR